MCNDWCLQFIQQHLERFPRNASVLEVGARDVNGSVRTLVEPIASSYVGVDIEAGPGVDQIVDAEQLLTAFATETFDVVLTTETVEHVRDWPSVFYQLLSVVKPGGFLAITTRSPGFELHGYPHDYWRYTQATMEQIFVGVATVHALHDDLTYGYASGVGVLVQRNEQGDLSAWYERLREEIALVQIECEAAIPFVQYERIEATLQAKQGGKRIHELASLVPDASVEENPVPILEFLDSDRRREWFRSTKNIFLCIDQSGQPILLPPLLSLLDKEERGFHLFSIDQQTWLFVAASDDHESLQHVRSACALAGNMHSVIHSDAPMTLLVQEETQSRIAAHPVDAALFNFGSETRRVQLRIHVSEHQRLHVQVNGALLAEYETFSHNCHQVYAFHEFLCAPGMNTLRITPTQPPMSITRIELTSEVLQGDDLAAMQDGLLRLANAPAEQHEEERKRYQEAIAHWQEQNQRLAEHGENQQRILDGLRSDIENHKLLLDEASKHIANLEAQLKQHGRTPPA